MFDVRLVFVLVVLALCTLSLNAAPATNLFTSGVEAYRASDFPRAADAFRASAADKISSGALQNLGNAEWKRGHVGEAIVAWEQVLWLNPFDKNARNNLRFARDEAQLEAHNLTWFEVVSSWLPIHWWAWVTAVGLWVAVGSITLPGVFRMRRAPWQQAVAVLALGILLLTIPAHIGSVTRAQIGFVLQKDTPLRLTPTADSETVTRLAAGEPVRKIRVRGNYVFVRTNRSAGWLQSNQFQLVSAR